MKKNEDGEDASGDNEQKEQEAEVPEQQQRHYDHLDKPKLFNALFVLADHWCPTTKAEEYKEFYDQLSYRLKYQGMQNPDAYTVL